MYVLIAAALLIAFLVACADRQARHARRNRAALERLRPSPAGTDYSGYSAERLIANRSERWD